MFVLPQRLLDSALIALRELAQRADVPDDARTELGIVATAVAHASSLSAVKAADIASHVAAAHRILESMSLELRGHPPLEAFAGPIDALIKESPQLQALPSGADSVATLIDFLRAVDTPMTEMVRVAPLPAQKLMAAAALPMLEWLNQLNALGAVAAPAVAASDANAVDAAALQMLLRSRLEDPSLQVRNLKLLQGGYGKETSLFEVRGDKINADLVLRRDVPAAFMNGMDCHEVRQEYQLLRALHARGFPVPEPLLLETDSTLVNGPDFIVVRRVPGRVEGDVTGGATKVNPAIQAALARVTARLHRLDPILELDEQIREMRPALWSLTASECVRAYIGSWYAFALSMPHVPVPTVHAMYNWLLDNIPPSDERPTLVHGDIGLHNLLFHEGLLSAVLDWEFSHVGDPAEDLGYILAVMGPQLDWPAFLDEYRAAGCPVPDMKRIRFFEIWSLVRNFSSSNIAIDLFASGKLRHVRYAMIPAHYNPYYSRRIEQLIRDWPG